MAKSYLKKLANNIFQEYNELIPHDDLETAFRDAVGQLPKGQLQKVLQNDFDKYLKRLENKIEKLCETQSIPSILNSSQDETMEELSTLDVRKDLTDHGQQAKHDAKLIYNLLASTKFPDKHLLKDLTAEQKQKTYSVFIRQVLQTQNGLEEYAFKKILKYLSEALPKPSTDDKSTFDWLPVMNHLLWLSTGTSQSALLGVIRMFYVTVETDVAKCLEKSKVVRAKRLSEILKTFLTSFHLRFKKEELKREEMKTYTSLMSAILSMYIDLCCLHSRKVEKKKLFGRHICGFVCYILLTWPESICEVILQSSLIEESTADVIMPTVSHCISRKPAASDHQHYLKYVLVVRSMMDKIPNNEQVQEYSILTKTIPAGDGFIAWLQDLCPEAIDSLPVEDKKFKRSKVTRFILTEADDSLITLLTESLSSPSEAPVEDDILTQYKNQDVGVEQKTSATVSMATEELFYIDTKGLSAVAGNVKGEKPTTSKRSHKQAKAVNTLNELADLIDIDEDEGLNSPQTFKICPKLIADKVTDPEDRKFLQSDIVSIRSLPTSPVKKTDVDESSSDIFIVEDDDDNDENGEKDKDEIDSFKESPKKRKSRIKQKGLKNKLKIASESESDLSMRSEEDTNKVKSLVYKVNDKKEQYVSESDMSGLIESGSSYLNTDQSVVDGSSTLGQSETTMSIEESDTDLPEDTTVYNNQSELLTDTEETEEQSVIAIDTDSEDSESEKKQNSNKKLKNKSPIKKQNLIESDLFPIDRTSVSNSDLDSQKSNMGSVNSSYQDSELERTVRYVDGKPCTSPRKSARKSNISESSVTSSLDLKSQKVQMSPNKGRKKRISESSQASSLDLQSQSVTSPTKNKSRKSKTSESSLDIESQEVIAASPKKSPRKKSSTTATDSPTKVAKKQVELNLESGNNSEEDVNLTEDELKLHLATDTESEFEVFPKSPRKSVKPSKTIEEKFIERACKTKTPKKGINDKSALKNKTESVSLYSEDESNLENETEGNNDKTVENQSSRTKSTEEIITIVNQIKKKIKTPKKKSGKLGQEKDESILFTDDSVESTGSASSPVKGRTPRKRIDNSETAEKELKSSPKKVNESSPKSVDEDNDDEMNGDMELFQDDNDTQEETVDDEPELDDNVDENKIKNTPVIDEKSEDNEISTGRNENDENSKDGKSPKKSRLTPKKMTEILTEVKSNKEMDEDFVEENKSKKTPSKKNSLKTPSKLTKTPSKEAVVAKTPSKEAVEAKTPSKEAVVAKTPSKEEVVAKTPSKEMPQTTPAKEKKTPLKEESKKTPSKSASKKTPSKEMAKKTPSKEKKTPLRDEAKKTPLKSASKKTPKKVEVSSSDDSQSDINLDAQSEEDQTTKIKSPEASVEKNKSKRMSLEFITTPPRSATKHSSSMSSGKKLKTPKSSAKLKALHDEKLRRSVKKSLTEEEDKELVVPSSQKRASSKSPNKVLQLTSPEFHRLKKDIQSSESETENADFPNIGKHLKSPEKTPGKDTLSVPDKHVDPKNHAKSPIIKTTIEQKSAAEKLNQDTPKPAGKSLVSPVRRRSLRPRNAAEAAPETTDTESDVIGPSQTKRVRSMTKTKPIETDKKTAAAKRTAPKAKKDIYDFHSGTDVTDQSDVETRPTRKSMGGRQMTTIKEKKEIEPKTPQGKTTMRKTSASTSKKFVQKVEELRGTRKRRLSGGLSKSDRESSKGENSTDSEVSFPKMKKVPEKTNEKTVEKPATKTSRRSSAAAAPVKEMSPTKESRRKSIRKK